MVTAPELRKFAKEHKFLIHPIRDIDEWVEKINANEGHCVCDFGRTCPCEEAIQEIEEDRGACVCTFFVSKSYLEENRYILKGGKWVKSKRRTKKSGY